MKNYLKILLIAALFVPAAGIIGCGSDDVDKQKYEDVKTELEKVRGFQAEANKAIENLRNEIRNLEIERQRLIAEKKRLEADIIDLKIRDHQRDRSSE